MSIDLDEMKRLAREATDIRDGKQWLMRISDLCATGHDERLIMATTPAAVLALIEQVEEAKAQIDAASLALNRQPGETLEQAAERAEEEISGLLERSGKVGTRAGVLDSQVAALTKRAEAAESERDAYKERVELLEGWIRATTKALTGEETTELRMAWTCEAVRELKARAELAEERVAARDKAFTNYVEEHGVEHDMGCPEDDTCDCPLIVAINATFRSVE